GDDCAPCIARCACNSCKARQALSIGQNLFGHYVEGWVLCGPGNVDEPLEPAEILVRIAQPIAVIEPQSVQPILGNKATEHATHGIAGAAGLHAQPGPPG